MAENDDDSQKTEEPTHKRLTDSRNKGDVPQSREVANWFMLFSAAVAVTLFAPFSAKKIYGTAYQFLESPHQRRDLHEVRAGTGDQVNDGFGGCGLNRHLKFAFLSGMSRDQRAFSTAHGEQSADVNPPNPSGSATTSLFALPPDTVVHCGHGPSTTIGQERTENPFVGDSANPELFGM